MKGQSETGLKQIDFNDLEKLNPLKGQSEKGNHENSQKLNLSGQEKNGQKSAKNMKGPSEKGHLKAPPIDNKYSNMQDEKSTERAIMKGPSETASNPNDNSNMQILTPLKGPSERAITGFSPILGIKKERTRKKRALYTTSILRNESSKPREYSSPVVVVDENEQSKNLNFECMVDDLYPQKSKSKNQITEQNLTKLLNAIQSQFNSICVDLPRAWITPAIAGKIKNRIDSWGPCASPDFWQSFFERVHASDFLCGRGSGFRASFHWLMDSENMSKVATGFYDNRPEKKQDLSRLTFSQLQYLERDRRAAFVLEFEAKRKQQDERRKAHKACGDGHNHET